MSLMVSLGIKVLLDILQHTRMSAALHDSHCPPQYQSEGTL